MPTTFQQNMRFSGRKEEQIDEFNFIGGMVTDVHETKLEQNQSPNLQNVIFNDTHSVKTRNGYLRYNNDPIGSSSDESNTGASTGTIALSNPGDYVAQTFQVGTQVGFVQVEAYLEMQTTGEAQYIKAELWSGGTGPSSKIADGQIKLVAYDSEILYSFRFRVPYTLAATTEYAIVLRPYIRGSTQAVSTVLVHRTGDAYANGQAYTSTDAGETWSAETGIDLKFNVYTNGDSGVTGLIRYYSSTGIKQQIIKHVTGLYRGDDGTGATNSITLPTGVSLNAVNFLDYTIVNDTLLIVDRDSQIKKYRGSTNANYSTGTITATVNSATVTGSGTSWLTSTNAEVGEYIQLPDGKWYKITAIASNTSLTIETAYKASTSAGASYVISPWGEVQGKLDSATAPASLVVPTPDFIESHANRVWTLEGNTLRWSALDTSISEEHFNDFDTSNNAGAIIIPSGKGDTGTGLYALGNALYVFQRRAIWAVYGTSPANFELRNITNETGMIDKKTLVEWNDIILFLSDAGIVAFDGSNINIVSQDKVENFINSWSNKTSPVATLWNNIYMIAYTPGGGSVNSEILYYDIGNGVFGRMAGVYASCFSRWTGGNDNGELYFGSSNQGSIYKWDVGGHDDGYEIETIYDTPSLSFGTGINDKAIKKFYIQQLALGDWDMTVTLYQNISETETASTPINLSAGNSSLWDVAQWDVDNWSGEGAIITTRVAEFQGIAKYFKFRIYQSGYEEGIEVLGMVATARTRRLQ